MFEKEINKLASLLDKAGIPYEMNELFDGWVICYPNDVERESDVICHKYSYGHEEGLLEMMGLTEDDDVQGYMTAEEVFEVWNKHYQEYNREE
jgi:hypothetical protein